MKPREFKKILTIMAQGLWEVFKREMSLQLWPETYELIT